MAQTTSLDEDVRLSPDVQDVIRQEVASLLGPSARVKLFGSRVDDSARGGDIDLWIELAPAMGPLAPNTVEMECQLSARISRRLGGRKVDVLIADEQLAAQPVGVAARQSGVWL